MNMMQEYLGEHRSPDVPLNVDATAFPLNMVSSRSFSGPTAMEDFPSYNYAIYLINTVKFHITQTYHLFEEKSFSQTLDMIYSKDTQPWDPHRRLEYIQYYTIMAFGKELLGQPPGSEYFLRAIEMFPDIIGLCQDPILSVKICCALVLYLQSIDHRNSAYLYVSTCRSWVDDWLTLSSWALLCASL